MMLTGLYLFTVLAASTGLLGHPHVLGPLAYRAGAARRDARDRHFASLRPIPSWARKQGQR